MGRKRTGRPLLSPAASFAFRFPPMPRCPTLFCLKLRRLSLPPFLLPSLPPRLPPFPLLLSYSWVPALPFPYSSPPLMFLRHSPHTAVGEEHSCSSPDPRGRQRHRRTPAWRKQESHQFLRPYPRHRTNTQTAFISRYVPEHCADPSSFRALFFPFPTSTTRHPMS